MQKGFESFAGDLDRAPCLCSYGPQRPSCLSSPVELLCQREESVQKKKQLECLANAVADLSERERFVIERHFGFGGAKASFTQIGKELRISKQRVGQVWKLAQQRIRAAFKPEELSTND